MISWHSYHDYDYNNGPSSYYYNRQIYEDQCRCIQLKYCLSFRELISKSTVPPSDEVVASIKSTHCGYSSNKEPLVCCPMLDPRSRRSSFFATTEKPWVWDVEENSHNQEVPNNDYNPENGYENFHNSFEGYHNNRFHHHFPNPHRNNDFREFRPHYEDERTRKNCPPSFSKDFDVPETVVGVTPSPSIPVSPTTTPDMTPTPAVPPPEAPIAEGTPSENTVIDRAAKETLINSNSCGISVNTRIIGGEDAGPGQFPWMARLAYRNRSKKILQRHFFKVFLLKIWIVFN